jgi:phospholipid/cholesterol/gamma-HCH transport system substrate-binding protein
MKKDVFETLMGFVILVIAASFTWFIFHNAYFAYNKKDQGYFVNAKFQNINGIMQGSDVVIAGIKIGQVSSMHLDKKTYQAIVALKINDDVNITNDSRASIVSSGIVGNKFIAIEPGSEEVNLKDGDSIAYTTSAVNLEALIGKFIYSMSNKSAQ